MIDVHSHCHQARHLGRTWERDMARVYRPDFERDFTPARYDEVMRQGGVSDAVVFGVRATAAGIATPNEYVQWFCESTETNTVPFMALDPSDEDVFAQLEDGLARGFRGIKCYPTSALFDPADTRFDPFYRRAADAGLVILWHMGATPVPGASLAVSQPLVVDEVARRHPDLRQVIAHLAHPWQRETIVTVRKNPSVFADVSAVWARPFDGFAALVRAQEWDVVPKLLFGSDFPHWTPAQATDGLKALLDLRPTGLPHVRQDTIAHLVDSDHLATLGLR
jgi:predicted TIM-barrel fold metal-dependent hydrolase